MAQPRQQKPSATKKKSRKPSANKRMRSKAAVAAGWSWKRRILMGVLLLLFILLLVPPVQVLTVRWFNPPLTTVMLQRQWEEPGLEIQYQWEEFGLFPRHLLWFTILSEDGRFFQHEGVDWTEMNHALEELYHGDGKPRGASTITMQCARSLFLWQGRSFGRKALELYYTFWMELFLSKQRIFELYLNVVETGPGIFGMPAGASHHYDRDVTHLSRPEAAMLVALLPAPLQWNPREPTATLLSRQKRILRNAKKWAKPQEIRQTPDL